MGWVEDFRAILPRLPAVFTLRDVYLLVPYFEARYPENRFVKEKLRQTLQILGEEGELEFLKPGQYRKIGIDPLQDEWPFAVGQIVTRRDLSQYYQQAGPGGLGRGMFKPAAGKPHDSQMVLFHDPKQNRYRDVVEEGRVLYAGEGQTGNQRLVGNNATLAKHLELGVRVHYFTQLAGESRSRYEGEMVVESWRHLFREDEQRSVIEYVLVPAGNEGHRNAVIDYAKVFQESLHPSREPRLVDRRRVVRTYDALVRSAVFSSQVLAAYEELCSVCGTPLRKGTFHELDAAHIVPVGSQGPDEVWNGLSLCKRHHWAFDHGVFTLTDNHRISWLLEQPDPHKEVIAGEAIHVPEFVSDRPHPYFLAIHRKTWL